MKDRHLDGSRVIVTGAGRGLGRSYALAAAAAGASVVVNSRTRENAQRVVDEIISSGGTAVASAHSVADPEGAEQILECCIESFGGVDGLVNNAAVYHEAWPWEETADRLREIVEVNVLGTMYCGAAVARHMKEQRHGSIVNVSSGGALGSAHIAAYSATKGAVASLTYAWALDFRDVGVRVNCLSPLAWTDQARSSEYGYRVRDRPPERVAPLVTFLLSDLADGITGQFIRFNGDDLSLVSPWHFAEPVVSREHWDVETIADAFGDPLKDALQPFGLERELA